MGNLSTRRPRQVIVLTDALHGGRAGGLSGLVVGPARVVTTVLRVHGRYLQDDEPEVTEGAEPAGGLQWPPVVVPLRLETASEARSALGSSMLPGSGKCVLERQKNCMYSCSFQY